MISQQSFLPLLTTIFPRQPSRKGDTWPLPVGAAWALLGVQPSEEDYGLAAEVRRDPQEPAGNIHDRRDQREGAVRGAAGA